MAYSNPYKIARGLVLDFTLDNANTAQDAFLGLNSDNEVTSFSSIPGNRVSGGNLTEATSSVLTITGGSGGTLGNVTIQVKLAGAAQSGYLSSTDWNTFNNKLSGSLDENHIIVGNALGQATNFDSALVGDILVDIDDGLTIKASAITNAMINSSAAITRSKLASGTAYRILANNASGVMSENAALTASRAIVSDSNGQLASTNVTTTQINYLSTLTANVQTQLNDYIATQPVNAIVKSPTSGEDFYAIVWDNANQEWTLSDPVAQGLPVGGTTNQYLKKASNTNYDVTWDTLTLSDVTDITASAADLNLLAGLQALGLTTTELFYSDGLSGNIQTQLNNKMSNSLVQHAIWVGNASNVAAQLAGGTNGQVLTIVGSTPTWQSVTGTGTVTSVDLSGGTTGLSFSGGPITTSGTITVGGTLDETAGGTGQTSYATGDILYASASNTLSKLAAGTDGYVLTLASGVPTWAAGGGGGVVDGNYGDITVSGSNTVWTINANINKSWTGNHTFLDSGFRLADNVDNTKLLAFQLSGITAGTTRTLTVPDASGTIALLGSANGAALTNVDDTNVTLTVSAGGSTALLNATSLTVGWSGQLAVTRGGTGLSTVTQGDLIYSDASNSLVALAKNTNATRYLSNTGTSNNPAWAQVNLTNGVTGALPIANGGTGATDAATAKTNLGATTAGGNIFTITNPSAVSFIRINADNTITARTPAETLSDIGAQASLVSGTNIKTVSGSSLLGSGDLGVIGSNYGGAGSVNGILKANGSGVVSAAVAGTDYLSSSGSGASLTGVWLLASGGTLTGVNTITSNTANQIIFNGTWTATANNQYHKRFAPSITTRNTNSDTIYGLDISPSITVNAGAPSGQILAAIRLNPTFTGTASKYSIFQDNLNYAEWYIAGNRLVPSLNGLQILTAQGYGMSFTPTNAAIDFPNQSFSLYHSGTNTNIALVGQQQSNATTARTFVQWNIRPSVSTAFTPTTGEAIHWQLVASGNAAFQPSSGTATWTSFQIAPTINQTGTASGTITYLDINPIRTSVLGTELALRAVAGSVLIGHTTLGASTTRLQVRGIGTTTGLLAYLEDSSGTHRLGLTDSGNLYGTAGTTSMTNGFFYIPSAAGVPSGTPTTYSNRVPMYYDSTNNDLYIYNGAWKKVNLA